MNKKATELKNKKYRDYSVSKVLYNYSCKVNNIEHLEEHYSDFYESLLPRSFKNLLGDELYDNLILNTQNSILDLIDKQGVESKDLILNNIKNKNTKVSIEFIFNLVKDKLHLEDKEDFIDLISLKKQYFPQLLKDMFSPSLEKLHNDRELERTKLAKETLKLLNIFNTKEK